MKKILLTIAAIATFTYNGIAQESKSDIRENLMFGMKAGLNYSNVYDAKGEQFVANPKLGIVAGAFVSIPIGKFMGIQPEILFSQKGFGAKGTLFSMPYEFTRSTNYIDIPLLFSLKPTTFISIVAGPQFSYLLKRTDAYVSNLVNIEQQTEFENDNIRKNTLGFVIGADININHLVFGARAGWDLQNNVGDGTSTTPRYKNVVYQATVGFRIY
ncbi:MAG: hypothetical protein A2033_05900 [Bacteroidetes bacterium GWA2_31_9]|nr:MAG: hypothetical protein A2033_05900 [Bacteroidetes bacterium GWA2_31_9]